VRVLLVMVNVPVFTASDVPRRCPRGLRSRYHLRREGVASITAVPETLPKKKTVEPVVVAVLFVTEIPPSTPENATKLEPVVSPLLTLPETSHLWNCCSCRRSSRPHRRCCGSGENVVENLTVVATARHSGALIWIASLLAKAFSKRFFWT